MKKIFLATIVCITAFFCTGCVQFSYDIEINNKDRVSLSETRTVQYRPMQAQGFRDVAKQDFQKIVNNYKKSGYDVKTNFNEDGNTTLTVKRDNLWSNDAAKIMPKGFEANPHNWLSIRRTLVKKYYKIHLTYKLDDAVNAINTDGYKFRNSSKAFNVYKDALSKIVISKTKFTDKTGHTYVTTEYANGNKILGGIIPDDELMIPSEPTAELTIKIPVKATANNATKVINDNTYQWILNSDTQPAEITLEYERWDFSNLAMVISLIIVVGSALMVAKRARSGGPVKGL